MFYVQILINTITAVNSFLYLRVNSIISDVLMIHTAAVLTVNNYHFPANYKNFSKRVKLGMLEQPKKLLGYRYNQF